ncbi:XRE family transcriptional regulator (plasmid) [Streptomyces mirabilis]|uniref:XRE family transcriptional regulator n=2 Tax=Streptomyces mirabilis TaxID=68239 RepID=A0ABU3V5G8_9ACTN|nr:XRE family transcriptional regulator [Streptomyces mirabilis]MDU9001348.1 XRE family transcriptional regulator [Streptomyces mirabilis]
MIGSRLRELRVARGLSLRALARATGMSATLLSQVERNVTEPSLSTLRKLTHAYGIHMADLFAGERAYTSVLSRPGERPFVISSQSGIRYERLTPANAVLEVLRVVLQPGEATSVEPWDRQSVQCAYVVSGTLSAETPGSLRAVEAGEAITFPAGLTHRYLNNTVGPVEFTISIGPPAT